MKNILLICADRTLSEEIRHVLRDKLDKQDGTPFVASLDNLKEAKEFLLTNSFDLVITDLNIPPDWSSPIDTDENGFELLEWMRDHAMEPNTPVELMIPRLGYKDSERIDKEAKKIPSCHVVPMGPKFMGNLVNLSRECLQEIGDTSQRGYLEVKINLANNSWQITGKAGMTCIHTGFLKIDEEALSDVGELSNQMEQENPRWQHKLEEIGVKLGELLLQPTSDNNSICTELLSRIREELARGNRGSLEDTRVRFILDPKFHSVLLESVMFPDESKFWMLQAPFSRQLCPAHTSLAPLFEGKKRFNCLLIDANLEQKLIKKKVSPTGYAISLEQLTYSSQECEDLKKLFSRHSDSVDRVELIRREGKEENFSNTVEDFLVNKGPWHLVHFSGHTHIDKNNKKGYVLLQDARKITPVAIAEFAGWLRRTSFIFLSSCQSSAKDFVLQLVRNQVPAVAGFRWDVEDPIAVRYTDVFYSELFSEKSLDRAFFKARRTLYEDHQFRKNRIWAAPMLVDQHDL